jgi:hypothetical protein
MNRTAPREQRPLDGAFVEPAGATSGNRWHMQKARKPLKQAKTVATRCDQLPQGPHGKEGLDGSSPSEGFRKLLQIGTCLSARTAG